MKKQDPNKMPGDGPFIPRWLFILLLPVIWPTANLLRILKVKEGKRLEREARKKK